MATSYKSIKDKIKDIDTVALLMRVAAEDTNPYLAASWPTKISKVSSYKEKIENDQKKVSTYLSELMSTIEDIETNLGKAVSTENEINWGDEGIEKQIAQKYELILGDKTIDLKNSKNVTIKVKRSMSVDPDTVQSEVGYLDAIEKELEIATELCKNSSDSLTKLKNDFDKMDDYCIDFKILSPTKYHNSNDLDPQYFKTLKGDLLERYNELQKLKSSLNTAIDKIEKFNNGGKNGGKNGKNNDKNKPKKLTKKRKNQLVAAIIAGKYGNGDARKKKLKKWIVRLST